MALVNNTAKLPANKEERLKAAQAVLTEIGKVHGDGTLMRLGSPGNKSYPHISTGILSLDYKVLGIGGLPVGRIIEVFGTEGSGKTTLALTAVAQVQKDGSLAAYVDAEHALDPSWCRTLGINTDDLMVSQPDSGEQALDVVLRLVTSGAFSVIVVDSVAALVPRAELEGDIGDANVGLQARLMSQAMRKLAGVINKTSTTVIFINQLREKIGISYGSPEVTTGGRALKFFSSVRLDVRRISTIKKGDIAVGNRVRIKGVKNKMSAPFRETEVDLLFDRGFDMAGNVFDLAVETGVITKSGSWYAIGDIKLGQGKETAMTILADTPEGCRVTEQVIEKLSR